MSAQTNRLKKRLQAIPPRVKEAVRPALEKSGTELVGRMQALAPEDTGDLKNSIVVTLPGQSTPPHSQPGGSRVAAENQVLVTAGNSEVRYPHLVEYGTSHSAAHPYFWSIYRLLRKRIQNRIKRAISRAVREGWQS